MGDKKYCICCGEEVPYYVVERDQKREYACSYCGFTIEVLKLWEEGEGKDKVEQEVEVKEKVEIEAEGKGGLETRKEEVEKERDVKAEITTEVKEAHEVEEKIEKLEGNSRERKGEERDSIKVRVRERPEKKEEKESGSTFAIIAEDSEFLRTLLKELIIKKSLAQGVVAVSNGLELVAEYTRLLNEKARINFAIVDLNMPEMDGLTAVKTIRTLEDKNSLERVPVVFFNRLSV